MAEGPIDLALEIAALLDRLGIRYVVGGSLASSLLGEPRATVHIDVAIEIRASDVGPLVSELRRSCYISEHAALEAVRTKRPFNAVHLESAQKVDLFVLGEGLLDRRRLDRRQRVAVSESPRRELWMTSAEDVVLRKLDWFRAGGGASDRQWRDVVGVLAVQGDRLDRADLEAAAAQLGLGELLVRASREAGTR